MKFKELTEAIKGFEEYHIIDANCHYCGNEIYLAPQKALTEISRKPHKTLSGYINIYNNEGKLLDNINEEEKYINWLQEMLKKNNEEGNKK